MPILRCTRLHPDVDVRVAASNDVVDLTSEHIDVAIHFVLVGAGVPPGEWLVGYKRLPVCSPGLARNRQRPHLAQHLRNRSQRAPLGRDWVAALDSFCVVVAPPATTRGSVVAFVSWLKEEMRHDSERMPEMLRAAGRAPAAAARTGGRSSREAKHDRHAD